MLSKLQLRSGLLLVATATFLLTACGATATTTATVTLTEQQKAVLRTIANGMGGDSSTTALKVNDFSSKMTPQTATRSGPDANGLYTINYSGTRYKKGVIVGVVKETYRDANRNWITLEEAASNPTRTYYWEQTTTENSDLFQLYEVEEHYHFYDIGLTTATYNYTVTASRTITFNNTVTGNVVLKLEYSKFKQKAYNYGDTQSTVFEWDVPLTLTYGTATYTGRFQGTATDTRMDVRPIQREFQGNIFDGETQIGWIIWNLDLDIATAYDVNGTKLE